jgi:ComEC/Rec2-related protein
MYPYPFFNLVFYILLVLVLILRVGTYDFNFSRTSNKNGNHEIFLGGYILRHPYQEDGFQIIELQDYKFKTLIYPKYYLGDYIKIKFKSATATKFAYFPEVVKISTKTNNVIDFLARLREFLVLRVKSTMPQPYAGLLLGLVIGYQQDFPSDLNDLLISTGVVHLVVFSGSNVSFITEKSFPLLYRFKSLNYFSLSTLIMCLIFILVGLEAPVIRAILMGLFQNTAKIFGYKGTSLVCLFYAFLLMVLIHPGYLFQLSFQLSFSASLVVIAVAGFTKFIKNEFLKSLVDNFLVILFLYPVISFYFGVFSIKSLFTNLLVSFVIPHILVWGFIYILSPNLICKAILLVLMDYFITISEFFNRFDRLNMDFSLSLFGLVSIYSLLGVAYLFWQLLFRKRFIHYE